MASCLQADVMSLHSAPVQSLRLSADLAPLRRTAFPSALEKRATSGCRAIRASREGAQQSQAEGEKQAGAAPGVEVSGSHKAKRAAVSRGVSRSMMLRSSATAMSTLLFLETTTEWDRMQEALVQNIVSVQDAAAATPSSTDAGQPTATTFSQEVSQAVEDAKEKVAAFEASAESKVSADSPIESSSDAKRAPEIVAEEKPTVPDASPVETKTEALPEVTLLDKVETAVPEIVIEAKDAVQSKAAAVTDVVPQAIQEAVQSVPSVPEVLPDGDGGAMEMIEDAAQAMKEEVQEAATYISDALSSPSTTSVLAKMKEYQTPVAVISAATALFAASLIFVEGVPKPGQFAKKEAAPESSVPAATEFADDGEDHKPEYYREKIATLTSRLTAAEEYSSLNERSKRELERLVGLKQKEISARQRELDSALYKIEAFKRELESMRSSGGGSGGGSSSAAEARIRELEQALAAKESNSSARSSSASYSGDSAGLKGKLEAAEAELKLKEAKIEQLTKSYGGMENALKMYQDKVEVMSGRISSLNKELEKVKGEKKEKDYLKSRVAELSAELIKSRMASSRS
eukprot:TRINITY_DN127_c0_g1_i2.p1 TRINITY_DN127_c0_g1~~TRINITY_DN127_c0_g1_i2.p1  ORF type:complete len:642 (+),score=139.51 TRINITY_DN127_c0_g1_i2:202-1926(+)